MPPRVEDEPQKVQQKLCREDGGGACGVVIGGNLDEVDAHHLMGLGHRLQQFQHFVVEKAAVAGRAGARCDGGAEGVDVDGDIDAGALGDAVCGGLRPQGTHLPDREDVRAARAGVVVAVLGGGTDVADAQLGEAGDIRFLGGAAHRVAVAVSHAVAFIDEIKMRVDLQDVDVALALKSVDAGDVD